MYFSKTVNENGDIVALSSYGFEPDFGDDKFTTLISKEEYNSLYEKRDIENVKNNYINKGALPEFITKNYRFEKTYNKFNTGLIIPVGMSNIIISSNDIYINAIYNKNINNQHSTIKGIILLKELNDTINVEEQESISINYNGLAYTIKASSSGISLKIERISSNSDIEISTMYSKVSLEIPESE